MSYSQTKTPRHCDSRTREPQSSFQDKKYYNVEIPKPKKNTASEVQRPKLMLSSKNQEQFPRRISTEFLTLSPLIEFSYCLSKLIFETNMMSPENIKMYQGQMFHSKDFGKAGPNWYSME